MGQRRLDSLTALRFFAALAVVGVHGGELLWRPLLRVTSLGYVGVTFFFILSGFVLTWSHQPGRGARRFYRNRFSRVWPLHALTWSVVVATVTGVHPGSWAALGLVQAWIPRASVNFAGNGPSWSLSCEAFFYLCFPLVVGWATGRRRLGLTTGALMAGTAIVGLGIYALVPAPLAYWAGYVLPPYRLGEFLLGALLATAMARGWRPAWSPSAAAGAVAGTWCVLLLAGAGDGPVGLHPQEVVGDVLTIPAFAALIAAAAARDADGRPWLGHPWLVRLGEWSFALYLIHQPIMRLSPRGPWALVACVVLAVVGSALVHQWVERPLERLLRGRRAPASACPALGRESLPEAMVPFRRREVSAVDPVVAGALMVHDRLRGCELAGGSSA